MEITIKYFSINSAEYVIRRYDYPIYYVEYPSLESITTDVINHLSKDENVPKFENLLVNFQNMSFENNHFMMSCHTERTYIRKLKIHQI